MASIKSGDIFSIQISPTEFAFGKVNLNIQTQCVDKNLITKNNPLSSFEDVILIEIYRETSKNNLPEKREVLIPGLLTLSEFFNRGVFPVVGFSEVVPQNVDFPESLTVEGVTQAGFVKGEIKHIFPMGIEAIESIKIYPKTLPPIILPEIILYQLGRKEEIKNPALVNKELRNLNRHDLRFSEHRQKVYEKAGLDPNESYYEMSKRMGFDLARFY